MIWLLGLLHYMRGLDGPPKPPDPPTLGRAPAQPWRASTLRSVLAGLDGPPKPPRAASRSVHDGSRSVLKSPRHPPTLPPWPAGGGSWAPPSEPPPSRAPA